MNFNIYKVITNLKIFAILTNIVELKMLIQNYKNVRSIFFLIPVSRTHENGYNNLKLFNQEYMFFLDIKRKISEKRIISINS